MSKKDIEREARALRAKMDPAKVVNESSEETLRALDQETRNEKVFDAAIACAACARERREKSDASALCREHLAAAMGF